MSERLLTVNDAADYLVVSPKTVYRLAARLGASKVGGALRFRKAVIDDYVEKQRLLPAGREVTPLRRAGSR